MLRKGSKIDIRNIPSVIGGDELSRKGIVLAKSPIAKKMGIVTAEPLYLARRKCNSLKIFPADYNLYENESDKIYEYLKRFTPDIERYSIDECFLDLSGTSYLYDDYIKLAIEIKNYIKDNFGVTVNIGIGNNRLCAKMASDFEKPDKIHTLFSYEIETKMWPLPVGDLFMIGKKSRELLNQIGIFTIGDLAHTNIDFLTKYFKNNSKFMIDYANGIDTTRINNNVKDHSISVSETLKNDIDNLNDLKTVLLYQADKVGRLLRKEKKYSSCVAVVFKNNKFISYTHQKKINTPINSTEEIYKLAVELLIEGWRNDNIRLIGIRLSNLTVSKIKQYSLFDHNDDLAIDKVQEVIDDINEKFGSCKITLASIIKNDKPK